MEVNTFLQQYNSHIDQIYSLQNKLSQYVSRSDMYMINSSDPIRLAIHIASTLYDYSEEWMWNNAEISRFEMNSPTIDGTDEKYKLIVETDPSDAHSYNFVLPFAQDIYNVPYYERQLKTGISFQVDPDRYVTRLDLYGKQKRHKIESDTIGEITRQKLGHTQTEHIKNVSINTDVIVPVFHSQVSNNRPKIECVKKALIPYLKTDSIQDHNDYYPIVNYLIFDILRTYFVSSVGDIELHV